MISFAKTMIKSILNMKNNVKKVLFGYDSENLAENSKVDNYAE